MTGEKRKTGKRLQGKTYKDAAVTNLPKDLHKTPPLSPALQRLTACLMELSARRPDGISLNEARRSCPQLLDFTLLQDHPSVRHLLLSVPAVVRLEGSGVQTRLFPAQHTAEGNLNTFHTDDV